MRLKFFFSRTLEKLGRTCDQIGRTLEPWYVRRYVIAFQKSDDVIAASRSLFREPRLLKPGSHCAILATIWSSETNFENPNRFL